MAKRALIESGLFTTSIMERTEDLKMDQNHAFFRLQNLSKAYMEAGKRHIVLQNATVGFGKGEFAAILGKSGSGKTTLLNLISGIDCPDQGEIYLNGTHLTGMNDLERTLFRREQIGFIFQFFNLIPTLTLWENVILPLELNNRLNRAGREHAETLINEVGLGDRMKAFPDRLSGGEQQRVAIARALVHDPSLVLADEPTGNLDEDTGRTILDLLDRLTRQAGKNLVMVTHSPEAAAYADHTYLLRDGRLILKDMK
jgi:putative ABC transport system ATP-binding protein